MKQLVRAVVLPVVVLAWAACPDNDSSAGSRIGEGDPQTAQLPQVQVKLPPPPSFQKDHAPEQYPDGTHSVYGVRKQMKETLDKPVKIKGFILDVYECPPCPKGQECPACEKPHLWLSDRANGPKDKALMVTDYPKEDERGRKTSFVVGTQYIVDGTFSKSSGTGFSASDGLLVFAGATPVGAVAE